MRDKLIELINHAKEMREADAMDVVRESECDIFDKLAALRSEAEYISDHLIANGVVVQKWIPVSERLPERSGKYLTCEKLGGRQCIDILDFATDLYEIDDYDFADKKGESGFLYWDSECGYCEIDVVTHWMPLPMPPKGE